MTPRVRTIGFLLASCWVAAASGVPDAKCGPGTSQSANQILPGSKPPAGAPSASGKLLTQAYLRVEWKAGRLTLDAEGIPLSEVVDAIARQARLTVEGADRLHGSVSTSLSSVTLGEAFQSLLFDAYYLLQDCSGGQGCQTELFIFGQAGSLNGRSLAAPRGTKPRSQMPQQDGTVTAPVASPEVTYFATEVEKKLAALQSAAALGDKEALREALKDPDVNVQSTAFEDLATWDPQGAVEAILSETKSDRPESRIRALQLLDHAGPVQDETVLSALANALRDEDASVKRYSIQALASRGESAMAYLERAFNDSDPSIRLIVVQSVAQQKEGLALIRRALLDSDQSVRDTAAVILKQTSAQNH